MARADINLTIAARLTEADRIARELTREMQNVSGEASRAFGSDIARAIAEQEPRIARSVEKAVTPLTRVNELQSRSVKIQEQALALHQQRIDAASRLSDMERSNLATDREKKELKEEILNLDLQINRVEQNAISINSQRTRALRDYTAALRGITKAQDDTNAEGGLGQSILSLGKFISAIRAVAIPVGGTLSAIIGAKTIASAAVLTQSLWMIPGAAAAAAAGIGSVSLATVGFGDAIKDIGDPEKFAAALQNLSPNAQQAALAIQAILPNLQELKNATQDAFFADGAEMITSLANQYLPMVQQLTTGIAGAFNKAFQGIFNELMKPSTQLVFQSIVDNLTAAFSRLADAAGPFSNAILNIINTGSSFLPQIADSAAKAAESFANFINTAAQNGDLRRWFEDGIWAVGQLWDGIKALAGGFASLAPAGKEYLPQIVALMENMAVILPPIIKGLGDMIPPITDISNGFQSVKQWFDLLFNGIQQAAPGMASAFGPLRDILNVIKGIIDKIRDGLGALPKLPGMGMGIGSSLFGGNIFNSGNRFGAMLPDLGSGQGLPGGSASSSFPSIGGLVGGSGGIGTSGGVGGQSVIGSMGGVDGGNSPAPTMDDLFKTQPNGQSVTDPTKGALGGIFGTTNQRPTAGIAPPPPGGYPLPPPPADKGAGGSGKSDEPPFTADPSTYSLDSIPIGGFFGGTGATGALPAPMMAAPGPLAVPDLTRANPQIDAITAIAAMSPFNLQMVSDVRNEPGSWHHVAQAGDFSNSSGPTPEMRAFALYMAQNFGHLIEELIYNDDMGGVGIKGGQPVDANSFYGPNDHRDHVHIAVKDAMAPYLAAAMQGNMFAGAAGGGYMSVDQEAIARAETDLNQARRTVEEKRLAYRKLEESGNADQLQLLRAQNDVLQAEENYREREQALAQARLGKYRELDNSLTSAASRVADSMGQVGAALADDFGLSEGLPGIAKWLTTFLANLAFAPAIGQMSAVSAMSPIKGGHGMFGMMGAQNIAAGRSPLGLSMGGIPGGFSPVAASTGVGMSPLPGVGTGPLPGPAVAPTAGGMAATGFTPTGVSPSAVGPAPLGGGLGAPSGYVPGTAGQGFFNSQAAASYLDQVTAGGGGQTSAQMSRPPTPGSGGGFGGLGDLPMAAIGGAISAGSLALDAIAPGAGAVAGQAAQTGVQVANRTAAYFGQLGGILAGGLMETFLPNSSEAGDPSKSWLGRIASGISGARPALPNTAGNSAPAQQPQQGQQGGSSGGPMVNIENMVNQTADSGQSVANQIGRMQMSAYASGGPR